MKPQPTLILILSLALVLGLSAWTINREEGQPAETPGKITVSGEAEVRVPPNEVILTVGVETWHKNLQTAENQNDQRVRQALVVVEAYGIEPRHVQTDHISIEPRYEDHYMRKDLMGYFVRKNLVITLKDIPKFDDLLASLVEADVNYIHGIQFRTTELRRYRDQARALAIQAAREKAAALAGELEQGIGRPIQITEDQVGWWSGYSWWGPHWGGGMSQNVIQEVGSGAAATGETIAPGQITVNARVTVSFELE